MLVSVTCRAWQPINRISFRLILMNSCYNVMCQYTSSQISTEGCKMEAEPQISYLQAVSSPSRVTHWQNWHSKLTGEIFYSSVLIILIVSYIQGNKIPQFLNLIPADKNLVLAYSRPGLMLIIKGHLVKLTVWRTQLMDCERALKHLTIFGHLKQPCSMYQPGN